MTAVTTRFGWTLGHGGRSAGFYECSLSLYPNQSPQRPHVYPALDTGSSVSDSSASFGLVPYFS